LYWAGQGPVDCAGLITKLISPLLNALIEDFLQTLLIVIGVSFVVI
jgi:hypothetical protein